MTEPVLELELDTPAATDRRRRRSSDPLVALHYQLACARTDGDLDAIVLADASGLVVAGAGAWATCEELAAYAPLLVQPQPGSPTLSARVEALRPHVEVRAVDVDGQEVLICARGAQAARGTGVARAAAGVSRILRGTC